MSNSEKTITKITVICTVRNGEHTIIPTINSVLAHSYAAWGMVIIADVPTDNTPKIIEQLAITESRIRFIKSGGIGRGKALNLAIKNSQSELIANLDADDLFHPQKLEQQLYWLQKSDAKTLLCTKANIISGNEEPDFLKYSDKSSCQNVTKKMTTFNQVTHSSILVKKEELLAVGGYDENRKSQFDYELWVRFIKNGYTVQRLEQPLTYKRKHEHQSFENKAHFKYLIESSKIQYRAILYMRPFSLAWLIPPVRIVWSFIPENIRMSLRKIHS